MKLPPELEADGREAASSPALIAGCDEGGVNADEFGGGAGGSSCVAVESRAASGIDASKSTIAFIADDAAASGLPAAAPGCSPIEVVIDGGGGRSAREMEDAEIGFVVLVEAE